MLLSFSAQRVHRLRCSYQQKRLIQQTEQNRKLSLGGATTVVRIITTFLKTDETVEWCARFRYFRIHLKGKLQRNILGGHLYSHRHENRSTAHVLPVFRCLQGDASDF